MAQVTCTTTAQLVPTSSPGTLIIQNLGSVNVYLGRTSAVTASGSTGGLQLLPGGAAHYTGIQSNGVYMVTASSTSLVAWELF